MEPQAPELIRQIKGKLHLTQTELAGALRTTQQTISNYASGSVDKERHDLIEMLKAILAGKIVVQKRKNSRAQELKKPHSLGADLIDELQSKTTSCAAAQRKGKAKKGSISSLPARRDGGKGAARE